jgi:hypothetical protein
MLQDWRELRHEGDSLWYGIKSAAQFAHHHCL